MRACDTHGLLTAVFGCDDTPINRWASRFLLLGPAVQRTFEKPGGWLLRAQEEMPILIFCDQGIEGKVNSWLKTFCPTISGLADVYNLHEKNTGRRIEATLGKWITLWRSPFEWLAYDPFALLEQVISRYQPTGRPLDRPSHTAKTRRTFHGGLSLWAQVNDASVLPNDPSGKRAVCPCRGL